jgi:alpha-soluble NSF attachment protein
MSNNLRAEKYIKDAHQLKSKWVLFEYQKLDNWEKAARLYEEAGNILRVQQQMTEAAEAFRLAADTYVAINKPHDAGNNYYKMGHCCKHDPARFIHYMSIALKLYKDAGKITLTMCNVAKEIAEVSECNILNMEQTINAYEEAAELYDLEGRTMETRKCLTKVAELSAQIENYDRAIEIYTSLVFMTIQKSALRFGVPGILFNLLLCHLAQEDIIGAQRCVEKSKNEHPLFIGSRECKFIESIMEPIKNQDAMVLSCICRDYDNLSPLQPLHITLLGRIKNQLSPSGNPIPASSSSSSDDAGIKFPGGLSIASSSEDLSKPSLKPPLNMDDLS